MDNTEVVLNDERMDTLQNATAELTVALQDIASKYSLTVFECMGILGMSAYAFVTLHSEENV